MHLGRVEDIATILPGHSWITCKNLTEEKERELTLALNVEKMKSACKKNGWVVP